MIPLICNRAERKILICNAAAVLSAEMTYSDFIKETQSQSDLYKLITPIITRTKSVYRQQSPIWEKTEFYLNIWIRLRRKFSLILQIELHERKQIPIPDSWGVDSHGKVGTTLLMTSLFACTGS